MKLVFTADEVATALQKTREEFDQLRPGLEAEGFPPPVQGLTDRWSIIDVINWLNNSGRPAENRDIQSWDHRGNRLS